MKAAIYARYSSDNQREESIEGQIRECMEYAEYNDIEIVGQYIDRAFSAKTDDRPDFLRMVNDSSKRLFDIVLVWKLDRFARNRYDSAFLSLQPPKKRRSGCVGKREYFKRSRRNYFGSDDRGDGGILLCESGSKRQERL